MTRRVVPVIERLLAKVHEDANGCWVWTGSLSPEGYGSISLGRRDQGRAMNHRYTYEFFRDEIPDGLHLDHLCRNRACCNPWHLEPVTCRVNVLRGDARFNGAHNRDKTHCVNGHEFTPENTAFGRDGYRRCRMCTNARSLARYHAAKEMVA